MTAIALADCDHFYVAVEQVFRPDVRGLPCVVAGNCDGIIVSRSPEAKRYVPMGGAIFQYQKEIAQHGIVVFSSNYSMYHDFSTRVHALFSQYGPIENYSIDEGWINIAAIAPGEREQAMREMRARVYRETGIAISVGIAASKVLAKLATDKFAKKNGEGIAVLDDANLEEELAHTPVEDIWSIGHKRAEKLRGQLEIYNALQLARADVGRIRRVFDVSVARVVCELNGTQAIPLKTMYPPRRQLICARNVGRPVSTLHELQEIVATYAVAAGNRMRSQHSMTDTISLFITTNRFREDLPQHQASCVIHLDQPTNSLPALVAAARQAVEHLYQPGFQYKKAGIMLLDLVRDDIIQGNLFADDPDINQQKLQTVIQEIERKFGRGTIYLAATGGPHACWKMRQEHLSPRYTTSWKELPIAHA
jgi:DNA polymerase V